MENKNKHYTETEIQFLKENYSSKSTKYCAEYLNRTREGISYKAKELGLKVSKEFRAETLNKHRTDKPHEKLNVNPGQFLNPQTPEVAYIFGIFWSDGCVLKNSNAIQLACVCSDIDNIKHIFDKTGNWTLTLKKRNESKDGYARKDLKKLTAYGKDIKKFFVKYGYGPGRPLPAINIVRLIPENIQHYWYLGLVDGDGSFSKNKNSNNMHFSVTADLNHNWEHMEYICNRLNICNYRIVRENKKQNYSRFYITNRQSILKLGNFIYQDFETNKIGLERKFLKFKELIPQENQRKSIEEWLPIAEKLSQQFNGVLPNPKWLDDNGYCGLHQHIRKSPEKFSHIEQEYKGGTKLKEWIPIAEKLAADNRGFLPNPTWLIKNGYYGLQCMLYEYPESFKHIEQNKVIKKEN